MFSTQRMAAVIAYAAWAVLSLPAAAVAQTCDHFDELVTTTPAPPQSAVLWKLHAQELANALAVNYDLLLIGDSLAQGWPDSSLAPLQVANFGVGGDQTQHVLWRMLSPELSRLRPRKVLIVIGTNNLTAGNSPCAIVMGIRKIIESAEKLWPSAQIGFLEIPPRGTDFIFKNDWRLETNAAIRLLPGIKTINLDDAITCGWHSPCANYNDDNLHFSGAGYQILGKAVRAALFEN